MQHDKTSIVRTPQTQQAINNSPWLVASATISLLSQYLAPVSVQLRTLSSIDQYNGLADGPHCPVLHF